jgi:predicted RNA-binding protein with PIN domain
MALLIDGYNLLNVTSIFGDAGPGTALHRTRVAFLNFLSSSFSKRERSQTTIVFDAAGAPPGLPGTMMHEGMTVHFAPRHSDADEMIEDLLETHKNPRSLTVVSSDHRVQRAARQRGATFVDSEQWYSDLKATLRSRKSANNDAAKPTGCSTPDELAYWLKEFGETPTPPDSNAILPPGYADDIGDDD